MALIRSAIFEDLAAITDIYNALLHTTTFEWTETPHTVAERSEWLRNQTVAGRPLLVAESDGRVVGWATYGDFRDSNRWPGYRYTVEHSIHVRQDCWGRGVGRALIGGLVDHAVVTGKRVMVAGIDAANVRSIAFHVHLGFEEVARMPGIGDKFGQRLDLVFMQLDLSRPLQ